MTVVSTTPPVLLIVFNRPETTRQVFQAIREARPSRLFVAADGPRSGKPGEAELCAKVRAVVSTVDWPCEVQTLFRERNLGCKMAVSSAIDWFFQNNEMGIILEDDCLPDPSFFPYCQQLLSRYREDPRVMMIAGTSYLFERATRTESYYFSGYPAIWGWATWKRAWDLYDIKMSNWPEARSKRSLRERFGKNWRSLWNLLDRTYRGEVDTWDAQWVWTCLVNDGLIATPVRNLISNIGVSGTHDCEESPFIRMPTYPMDTDHLVHPAVDRDTELDGQAMKKIADQGENWFLSTYYSTRRRLRRL